MRKLFVATVFTILTVFSFSSNAALISVDWKESEDNLISRDTVSGLDWLDLTETNRLSRNFVKSQFGIDGQFSGFRYATNDEVVALWKNFNIDLSSAVQTHVPGIHDPAVADASEMLGNILYENAPSAYPNGTLGITSQIIDDSSHAVLGAFTASHSGIYTHYYHDGHAFYNDNKSSTAIGSYLVKPSVVPIPAAAWLFGSGLLGLIAAARRNKNA